MGTTRGRGKGNGISLGLKIEPFIGENLPVTLIIAPTPENIKKASVALKNGALIGMPTETVYGLAGDAENECAVKRIYDVKGRPYDHPLIVHIGSHEYLDKWAVNIPEYARKLASEFWPGPITLILERTTLAKDFITGNQDSVGIRFPSHNTAIELLKAFHSLGGNGLAAPSANNFGAVSPTEAEAVNEELGRNLTLHFDFILDGGNAQIGIESTIVSCLDARPSILRFGSITKSDIEQIVDIKPVNIDNSKKIKFSGKLEKHYSPLATLVLNSQPESGDGFIALKSVKTPINNVRLASPVDALEFAKQLYASLRKGDKLKLERINVILPVGTGIEIALEERLRKAAHQL